MAKTFAEMTRRCRHLWLGIADCIIAAATNGSGDITGTAGKMAAAYFAHQPRSIFRPLTGF